MVELGFPLHIALIPVAISAAALLAGMFLFVKVSKLLGLLIGAFATLFGAFFGPMLLMDRVVLDHQRIRQHTGLWFDQTVKGFDLEGIERVTITTGRDLKGREIEVWVAQYGDRADVQVDPGDLWESNGEAVSRHLRSLGIEVVRSPD